MHSCNNFVGSLVHLKKNNNKVQILNQIWRIWSFKIFASALRRWRRVSNTSCRFQRRRVTDSPLARKVACSPRQRFSRESTRNHHRFHQNTFQYWRWEVARERERERECKGILVGTTGHSLSPLTRPPKRSDFHIEIEMEIKFHLPPLLHFTWHLSSCRIFPGIIHKSDKCPVYDQHTLS